MVNEVELLTIELSQKLVENELLGREISLADVEKEQQYRRPAQPIGRKRSPISPLNEQYNTSSFEEDLHTESKVSRSEEEEEPLPQRKTNMGGTGRFTTAAFEHQKLPRQRLSSSSSTSTTPTPPKGIIIKPTIAAKKPSPTYEKDNQYSDDDFESSISSKSKERQRPRSARRRSSGEEDDDDLLLSTKTGEKIYSTDFEESKSKVKNLYQDDDEDDEDIADTMKLSARSVNTLQRSSSDSDDS